MNDVENGDEDGYPCGAEAGKKFGFCWVCDYHFKMFASSFGAAEAITKQMVDGVTRNIESKF